MREKILESVSEPVSETRTGVQSALLALSDRSQSEALAQSLVNHGARIYATSGTAAYLRGLGIEVQPAQELTHTRELLGGRIKTLSSELFASILARRDDGRHMAELAELGVTPLDLVAVTLYPFESLDAKASWEEASELIDIGGVSLLRAAAKNFADVAVLSSPGQYPDFCTALEQGGSTPSHRRRLAQTAFERTAEYDSHIARFFLERGDGEAPEIWVEAYRRSRSLRYGENPHQEAALYTRSLEEPWWITGAVHEGKELSFNNLLDLQAALRLVNDFVPPACGIVKHNEPSGVGLGERPDQAFEFALAGDPISAYGGVVAFNREVDGDTAKLLCSHFFECVAAPGFSATARQALEARLRLRVIQVAPGDVADVGWQTRPMIGGLLVQRVRPDAGEIQLEVVTRRAPTPAEMEALHFAWTVVGRARSNAVVVAETQRSLGVGSGQTSRIDALTVALMKARRSGIEVDGSVLASDGFFPFADWVPVAREAGITACIQPGGSVRDGESVTACDEVGMAMVFTGRRQFRH